MNSLIRDILSARVYDVAKNTQLDHLYLLSQQLKCNIWLKREDLQPIFSFKIRGAFNRIFQLSDEEKAKGVVCASAGNHAQGVALSGLHLKLDTTIVMPTSAPLLKVNACREMGANVILHGNNFDEAYAHALHLSEIEGKSFIHPFDDLAVISGQGTIGKEMLDQKPDLDAIFIPVGGGGLIAGVAAYVKFIAPNCKIIGVEPEESASMKVSLESGERVNLPQVGTFADGTAVKLVGEKTFELCQKYVDEIITVSTDELCAAMKDIFNNTRALSEPSGALSVAGIKKYLQANPHSGFKNVAGILSGANINFDRLRYVAERAELGERNEALIAVKIPESPGSFQNFINLIGKRSITEFNYRYGNPSEAVIFVGLQLSRGDEEKQQILERLQSHQLDVVDLSDNEMAKLHIRHMVGGKADAENERLFRFEFPERPGALLQFLSMLAGRWNISLFHYRNHGSDYGRVLIGMQVPEKDLQDGSFQSFLDELGYQFEDENENPAFKLFL
ncbi:L-threonine dehydratase [Ignatzschineria indica]|uniref:L-threonine dehydratase n=1 Tax=Ignatzschineria indica TaxID=472583 RepID=A0A2U2AP27_9GAMM|nr:threonine ammonia-lyase, biosynthetic [Ignatzschineria indica]PWD84898.1 threonine ammonia-lyase, biosynthetic [Ignatzschineria indica]GGZ80041.1 L-threonine dehydratase [Ignatzschineria indica]